MPETGPEIRPEIGTACGAARPVEIALRCYPARWRRRHGAEAAELAALLIRDGTPAASIAWSYLAGAAREWLTPHPARRLRTAACAVLIAACSLGVSAGLLASAAPARAASPSPPPARTASPSPPPARAASPSPPPGSAPCRPGPVAPVPGVIPALGRPQVIIREAGHARPC